MYLSIHTYRNQLLQKLPSPIADALYGLEGAGHPFEKRDRIVEVFRTLCRTIAGITLAVRVQYGSGPLPESQEILKLFSKLHDQHLTDGQWVQISKLLLKPWKLKSEGFPLRHLLDIFYSNKSSVHMLIDEFLKMRRKETIAHGSVFSEEEVNSIIQVREPQIYHLLSAFEKFWDEYRFVVPLKLPDDINVSQEAWLISGISPRRSKWRRISLPVETRTSPGELILIDSNGYPSLVLDPIIIFQRPTPDALEECFFLDGNAKKGAKYISLPDCNQFYDEDVWNKLDSIFASQNLYKQEVSSKLTSPYKGLETFQTQDSDIFFGRKSEVINLVNKINNSQWVTLTGSSGSGKSSLVFAGVIPNLTDYDSFIMRPGYFPKENLLKKLKTFLSLNAINDLKIQKEIRNSIRNYQKKLLLVIDQGEELFSLCNVECERENFLKLLFELIQLSSNCHIVYIIREDFFSKLTKLKPHDHLIVNNLVFLNAPNQDEIRGALVEPAKLFNYKFEDGLVDEIVNTARDENSALSLIQFCVGQMWLHRDRRWHKLTWDSYNIVGGVIGALTYHADKVLNDFMPHYKVLARRLLLRLVSPQRTRAVVLLADFEHEEERSLDMDHVINTLVLNRLITRRVNENKQTVLELVHESLITQWSFLKNSLSENKYEHKLSSFLYQNTQNWISHGCPKSLLLNGAILNDIISWEKHSEFQPTVDERDYLNQSTTEERKVRLRLRLITIVVILSLVSLLIFSLVQNNDKNKANASLTQHKNLLKKSLEDVSSLYKQSEQKTKLVKSMLDKFKYQSLLRKGQEAKDQSTKIAYYRAAATLEKDIDGNHKLALIRLIRNYYQLDKTNTGFFAKLDVDSEKGMNEREEVKVPEMETPFYEDQRLDSKHAIYDAPDGIEARNILNGEVIDKLKDVYFYKKLTDKVFLINDRSEGFKWNSKLSKFENIQVNHGIVRINELLRANKLFLEHGFLNKSIAEIFFNGITYEHNSVFLNFTDPMFLKNIDNDFYDNDFYDNELYINTNNHIFKLNIKCRTLQYNEYFQCKQSKPKYVYKNDLDINILNAKITLEPKEYIRSGNRDYWTIKHLSKNNNIENDWLVIFDDLLLELLDNENRKIPERRKIVLKNTIPLLNISSKSKPKSIMSSIEAIFKKRSHKMNNLEWRAMRSDWNKISINDSNNGPIIDPYGNYIYGYYTDYIKGHGFIYSIYIDKLSGDKIKLETDFHISDIKAITSNSMIYFYDNNLYSYNYAEQTKEKLISNVYEFIDFNNISILYKNKKSSLTIYDIKSKCQKAINLLINSNDQIGFSNNKTFYISTDNNISFYNLSGDKVKSLEYKKFRTYQPVSMKKYIPYKYIIGNYVSFFLLDDTLFMNGKKFIDQDNDGSFDTAVDCAYLHEMNIFNEQARVALSNDLLYDLETCEAITTTPMGHLKTFSINGEYIYSKNGSIPIPKLNHDEHINKSGNSTNIRICESNYKPVSILPYPDSTSIWADKTHSTCRDN